MIIVEKPSWLRLVFRMHGSAFPRIWRRVLFITLVAAAFTRLQRYPAFHYSLSLTPFLLVGLPLGIILGFRNTAAYDRYWEGRKLWGSLVNTSRTLEVCRWIDRPFICLRGALPLAPPGRARSGPHSLHWGPGPKPIGRHPPTRS